MEKRINHNLFVGACFVFLFLMFPFGVKSQPSFLNEENISFQFEHEKDQEIINYLERIPDFSRLSTKEKAFFYWANVFRKNPKEFGEKIIKPYLVSEPKYNNRFAKSLFRDLENTARSLPFFYPASILQELCESHCLDIVRNGGRLSHRSSSGKSFSGRVDELSDVVCSAENLFAGYSSPLEAIIALLIDSGVESLGHRKNLMNPHMERMWVSIKYSGGEFIVVQDLACKNPCKY
ncbi:MAG: CAP domain-containing protein [Bacteroidota bacterium]